MRSIGVLRLVPLGKVWVFGEGGDEAVDLVVDHFMHEGEWWSGEEVGFWGGFAGEQLDDELQIVKEFAGAGSVDVVGGNELEYAGGGGKGGGPVFDEREIEGLRLVSAGTGGGFGAAGGVVVIAEVFVAEGGRSALVSGGVDVAAAVAGLGDGGEFGLVEHVSPLGDFDA